MSCILLPSPKYTQSLCRNPVLNDMTLHPPAEAGNLGVISGTSFISNPSPNPSYHHLLPILPFCLSSFTLSFLLCQSILYMALRMYLRKAHMIIPPTYTHGSPPQCQSHTDFPLTWQKRLQYICNTVFGSWISVLICSSPNVLPSLISKPNCPLFFISSLTCFLMQPDFCLSNSPNYPPCSSNLGLCIIKPYSSFSLSSNTNSPLTHSLIFS